MVMETYLAADLSAEQNEPIDLPLSNQSLSAITAMTEEKKRAAVG
jgi:myo-inositol 2-dehydrogenase/D-chiro-inositol 1-dehydrogenase